MKDPCIAKVPRLSTQFVSSAEILRGCGLERVRLVQRECRDFRS